jgi:hypothetical protein
MALNLLGASLTAGLLWSLYSWSPLSALALAWAIANTIGFVISLL